MRHLVESGYLDSDGGMLFIGPEAELRFGRRHFMDMTAVFTGPPEFTVLDRPHRDRAGSTRACSPRRSRATGGCCSAAKLAGDLHRLAAPAMLRRARRRRRPGPLDRHCGWAGRVFELTRAMRDVLLGADPPVRFTSGRGPARETARDRDAHRAPRWHRHHRLRRRRALVDLGRLPGQLNLAATLSDLVDPLQRFDDVCPPPRGPDARHVARRNSRRRRKTLSAEINDKALEG